MDSVFILQILDDSLCRISTNADSKIYELSTILTHLPQLKNMLLISPLDFNTTELITDILSQTGIQNTAHFFPSAAASFSFETHTIFYVSVSFSTDSEIVPEMPATPIEKEESIKRELKEKAKIKVYIEVIKNMILDKPSCITIKGEFQEVVNDTYFHLNGLDERITLASNIYIECENKDLKQLFEEKLVMEVCQTEKCGRDQIERIKYLKTASYIKDSVLSYEGVKNNPVVLGALIGARARFVENSLFMTRKEFEAGKFDKFWFHK